LRELRQKLPDFPLAWPLLRGVRRMNTAGSAIVEDKATGTAIHLPGGLLGFEHIKDYVLISNPGEEPFQWLQVSGDPSLAFLVVSPHEVMSNYAPDISAEDIQSLQLEEPGDALIFNIVTLRSRGRSTVNLKGPVVINQITRLGKQVVLSNAAEYSVQHPLPYSE
jgi:flagellar assembly factor FliW